MNKFSKTELISTCQRRTGCRRAFTLTELLVVIGMTTLLATMLLSVSFSTRERVLRVECVSNLRQVGVGLNIYSTEANGYVPICGWANPPTGSPNGSTGNPWQTYQVCRCSTLGSTNIILGFENLGLLFRTKVILNPKTFYCPSTSLISGIFSYSYYANALTGWPASPTNSSDNPYVRTGYNYYPQLRATERINDPNYGTVILPKVTSTSLVLEFGGTQKLVTPAKLTDLDPKKSITTDLVNNYAVLSHQTSGSVAGLNALFPDGRVTFQTVRNHNAKGSQQPFDPLLWDPHDANGAGPADDPTGFRMIMAGFQP
jgi:type II secretory pathway pseudopilin PulG